MKLAWVLSGFLSFTYTAAETILQPKTFAKQLVEYHPRAFQASLRPAFAQASWLKAKGLTEPGFNLNYDRKTFDGKNYWNLLGGGLSIPTLYGIEIYSRFDHNSGQYMNPENSVPMNGLYAGGLKVPLGNGLWQSKMRFERNKAFILQKTAPYEQKTELNDLLHEGMEAYWTWVETYNIWIINRNASQISEEQFQTTRSAAMLGDRPLIDTVESHMQWQSRLLATNDALLNYRKHTQHLLTFIWQEYWKHLLEQGQGVPPLLDQLEEITNLVDSAAVNSDWMAENPLLMQFYNQTEILSKELRFRQNQLLPKAEFKYNLLYDASQDFQALQTIGTDYYKAGIGISFPIFMRQERAAVQYTRLKQQEVNWEIADKQRQIAQKINANFQEYVLGLENARIQEGIQSSYQKLLDAEIIRFRSGESSVFLLNQRENMCFQSQAKRVSLEIKWRMALIRLFHTRGDLLEKLILE
ncbi:MAG: hypothetical protein GC180_08085 [Bacteroidetes bacterium]|nr:hypothetical protein [Bacteroidota bacterium]